MDISKFINSDNGSKFISVIWGIGLATLFRHACIGRNCIVIKGPEPNEVKNNNYKFNNKCYKYDAYAVSCK